MGLPTYKASGGFGAGTSTVSTAQGMTMPAGVVAGDVLLMACESENQVISLTTANGFVEVTNSPQGTGTAGAAGSTRLAVYWKRAVGSDAVPVIADSGDHQTGQIHCFSGCKDSGNPWNITAGGVDTVSDVSAAVPGATTTADNCLVVLLYSSSNDATATTNFSGHTNADLGSLTERTDNTNTVGLGGGHGMATGTKVAAGAYTTTAVTYSVASLKAMMSIALQGAADYLGPDLAHTAPYQSLMAM